MGGQIGVRSLPFAGSTFWFEVQLARSKRIPREKIFADTSSKDVAIVGTNANIQSLLEAHLQGAGFRVIRYAQMDEVAPGADLVVLDVFGDDPRLSDRIRAMRLRVRQLELPVVVLSPVGRLAMSWADIDVPHCQVLLKPIRRQKLRRVLGEMLGFQPIHHDPERRGLRIRFSEMRILVAEDNDVNQMVAQHLLETLGCKVKVAANGRQAVEMAATTDFDLIFMDCQMPIVDGYEATSKIRAREASSGRHVPIIAMTANAADSDREGCLRAGMDDFVAKPITEKELVRAIRRNVVVVEAVA